MADLLSKDMIVDIIINIINIVILFILTKTLLYKPVKKILNARREKLDAEHRDAQSAIAEAEAKKAEYDAFLSDAQSEKEKLLRAAEAEAQEKARSVIADAEKQAGEILAKSEENAKREKEKYMSDARSEIAGLAVEISSKILGREITDADNRAIAESFFGEGQAKV